MRLLLRSSGPAPAAHVPPGGRATSFALALAVNLLILLALLSLNRQPAPPRNSDKAPTLIDLAPAKEPSPEATQSEVTEEAAAQEAEVRPAPKAEVQPRPAPKPPEPVEDDRPLPMIVLTREDFLASNIARFGNRAPAPAQAEGRPSRSRDSQQVGTAPNGEPLYQAEWYRRPTDAELGAYLPTSRPVEGWGLIACRTVARYRVEDCVELGDSPPGSRLAGAVRQAAWQFLVRPPRVGGKELVGTWVRIRIDYTATVRE